jgi:hypothetical protein
MTKDGGLATMFGNDPHVVPMDHNESYSLLWKERLQTPQLELVYQLIPASVRVMASQHY